MMNNKKLALQWFIEQHFDWEDILSQKPYCITITRDRVFDRNLIMFKYSQIDSDFHLELVRECRGIILDEDTHEVVCHAFDKFGNYGESYCPQINWKNCHCTQKLDGSLIKMVKFSDNILVSTNGTIDAFKAPIVEQIGCKAKNFGELACEALANSGIMNLSDIAKFMKENFTYMFELTSPFNKVVVTWHETKMNYLGCRDNISGQEYLFTDGEFCKHFNTPKIYDLSSVDACVNAAKELGVDEEGYVVVDDKFNRVKIKSPTYVSLHHMKNNGVLSYERGIEIVRGNELGEVLTYFPEFKDHLEMIKEKYDFLKAHLETSWDGFMTLVGPLATRKEQAIWIQKNFDIPGVGFCLLDNKVKSVEEWLLNCPAKNLVKALGLKEQKIVEQESPND